MRCPECDNVPVKIIDSRPNDTDTERKRRYKCLNCDHKFNSIEHYEIELEKLILEYQMEIEDTKDVFMWLWRSIYATSMNDAAIKDLRWNIENYTSQTMKSKLKRLVS